MGYRSGCRGRSTGCKDIAMDREDMKQWIIDNPESALAKAASHWGFDPRIVY
jgi:hypothetical protein